MDERRTGWGFRAAVVLAMACALLMAYALSVGPAAYLELNGMLNTKLALRLYEPLFWTARNCEPFRHALEWYLSWWAVEAQSRF